MKKPALPDIIKAASKYFKISEDDLCNPQFKSKEYAQERLAMIFVAAEADYSNKEIADSMNYRSSRTVSGKFNTGLSSYGTPMNKDDMNFRKSVKGLAKFAHVTLG